MSKSHESLTFSLDCQKILDKIPVNRRQEVIEGLKLLQYSEIYTSPNVLKETLEVVFGVELRNDQSQQYQFAESPLKSRLASELASNEPKISVDAMAIIVAEIKERFKKKGIDFNCFVFSDTNLDKFLISLENDKDKIKNDTRFLILSLNEFYKHWSLLDIRIRNGVLQFYLLDAAFLSNRQLILKINIICNNFSLKYSSGNIQSDDIHCAFFTIDHATQSIKIPDFHDKFNTLKSYMYTNKNAYIQFIPLENYVPELGPLLRNMQSLKRLDKLSAKIPGLLGSRSVDLNNYLNSKGRIQQTTANDSDSQQNISIKKKSTRTKEKALTFLLSLDEKDCKNLINSICNITTLPDEFFQNQQTQSTTPVEFNQKISSDLISSRYFIFERTELLSFILNFKCEKFLDSLCDNGKINFDLLSVITNNMDAFSKLYRDGALTIGNIAKLNTTELQSLLNLVPEPSSTSKYKRNLDSPIPKKLTLIEDDQSQTHKKQRKS